MEWLWLVASLKLQVSFAEYSLFYRALLQKRPIILRSLLVIATSYEWDVLHIPMSHDIHQHAHTHTLQKRPMKETIFCKREDILPIWMRCVTYADKSRYNKHAHTHTCTRTRTYTHMHRRTLSHTHVHTCIRRLTSYGVATISRLLKIIGLFCRISSLL